MMLWNQAWREATWTEIDQAWDIIVVGGGITGAGILREATHQGFRCLLVEANDFAFGTSSRSSKMIHGGFRYLANHQFDVTHESVLEREWMLKEAKYLVTPLQFLIPIYHRSKVWQFKMGTIIYDWMAKRWRHRFLSKRQVQSFCPMLAKENLRSGVLYYDAQMDDSRFVIRLIRESVMAGATALNYASVIDLLRDSTGKINGVRVIDTSRNGSGMDARSIDIHARIVINATGPWSDEIRAHCEGGEKIRQLRGSHLVLPLEKFPLNHGVTLVHPDDGRAMFALPWEGTMLIGTTDIDHSLKPGTPGNEPWCTHEEINYILRAVSVVFPGVHVDKTDIISSMAGLRPIISSGKEHPSDESRAHAVWEENGMISVGGGKFTIFRLMAQDVMAEVRRILGLEEPPARGFRYFNPLPVRLLASDLDCLDATTMNYLSGRYGLEISDLVKDSQVDECTRIASLPNVWAELRWTAKADGVVHLDDLLLRRVRLGILLPNGAEEWMSRIRSIIQPELDWTDQQWEEEYSRYRKIWEQAYAPEPRGC